MTGPEDGPTPFPFVERSGQSRLDVLAQKLEAPTWCNVRAHEFSPVLM